MKIDSQNINVLPFLYFPRGFDIRFAGCEKYMKFLKVLEVCRNS
jgi:hypothetical protein